MSLIDNGWLFMIILCLQVLALLKRSTVWLQVYLFMVQPHPAKLRDPKRAWKIWLTAMMRQQS